MAKPDHRQYSRQTQKRPGMSGRFFLQPQQQRSAVLDPLLPNAPVYITGMNQVPKT
jgi:hypothetical protein